jgi:hypothetical protein
MPGNSSSTRHAVRFSDSSAQYFGYNVRIIELQLRLARVHFRTMDRRLYLVGETTASATPEADGCRSAPIDPEDHTEREAEGA